MRGMAVIGRRGSFVPRWLHVHYSGTQWPCTSAQSMCNYLSLNPLTRTHGDLQSVFPSEPGLIPDPFCLAMLGSTDLISADFKETIRGVLRPSDREAGSLLDSTLVRYFIEKGEILLETSEHSTHASIFLNAVLLQSCNKLLEQALLVNHILITLWQKTPT